MIPIFIFLDLTLQIKNYNSIFIISIIELSL